MVLDKTYNAVMKRRNAIMKKALGIDYDEFIRNSISFDYERMMKEVGYTLEEIEEIQGSTKVGQTPLFELKNITKLIRKHSPKGKGARIFLKDEAANSSGSFKARRASVSLYEAEKKGYKGVIAATSGNYGAAVAAQAAQRGLKCIIIQEMYDSKDKEQPEIVEKARKCEAYGAEVIMMSVGPELFYYLLSTLEDTGFFNASLYTPFGIAGIETLGKELVQQTKKLAGKEPDAVLVTNAGGGNLTGTARGILKSGAVNTQIVAVSVDLSGLHMASDIDFNLKSFTTGHTGFGIPFTTWPDRTDVPKNAARPLRYLDRYLTVKQGEVFYATEMLARLEGLERGPAGSTSLAAAVSLAREMDEDQVVVIQETEYTGAGKHPTAQLTFAKENGIELIIGDPKDSVNGKNIVFPKNLDYLQAVDWKIEDLKKSYFKNVVKKNPDAVISDEDLKFLSEDSKSSVDEVKSYLNELRK